MSETTSPIAVTTAGDIAVIEVRRPPANYFDQHVLGTISAAGRELAEAGTRAIVLASQGKHFCAGADFSSGGLGEARVRNTREIYAAAQQIFTLPVPLIAAVQGAAVGGGLGLACAADFRVAAPTARFHANFAALGFHQGFGLSVSLPRIIGEQEAARMLLTAQPVNGVEARRIGLADILAEDGPEGTEPGAAVREAACAFARVIAAQAPLAVRSIRETLRAGLAEQVSAVLEHEIGEQTRLWQTADCAEGIAANLERRPAAFTGK